MKYNKFNVNKNKNGEKDHHRWVLESEVRREQNINKNEKAEQEDKESPSEYESESDLESVESVD